MLHTQQLIDYCLSHLAGLAFVALGVGGVLYSCFAKYISFQGDFPLTKEERKTSPATRDVRIKALIISLLPLAYGIKLLLFT
jgi:hypothetical protein